MIATQAPKTPLLEWHSLFARQRMTYSGVLDLPYKRMTTSGRAAIHAALQMLDLPRGSRIAVPTYHCPTMVAPIVLSGLKPMFFAIGEDGLPLPQTLVTSQGEIPAAVIAPHFFGMPRSMRVIRQWCDEHDVFLIEDCAHTLVGQAGDRPVGSWGDFAIASLSKFFPLQEAGIVASTNQPVSELKLEACSLRRQLKAVLDPLEIAARHGRLWGLRHLLLPLLALKDAAQAAQGSTDSTGIRERSEDEWLHQCDLSRIHQDVPWTTRAIHKVIAMDSVVQPRQENFRIYSEKLRLHVGACDLDRMTGQDCAPYVFPLRVRDPDLADHVYHTMRDEGYPVYRWDRLWPGTPLDLADGHDAGAFWSREVIQLLCHQSLTAIHSHQTAQRAAELLTRG